MPFAGYAKSRVISALEATSLDVASDVYVVSLFVYDEEDDPRYPTITVGFNTESRVASTAGDASDEDEARWNFAFWLQNELAVIGARKLDPEGAELRAQWIRDAGL